MRDNRLRQPLKYVLVMSAAGAMMSALLLILTTGITGAKFFFIELT